MSTWRPVAIRGCSAIGAFGVGMDSFRSWWSSGRNALDAPIYSLNESWLPFERACEVPEWRGRNHLPDRKAIKLMTRRVQLGVAAALEAWGNQSDENLPPPHRRAMYTGCGVPADEDWTFRQPIQESIVDGEFDMRRFSIHGQEFLNPLWLVKSLTNNVLAFTAKTLDLQGSNNNFEGDGAGTLVAIAEASRAIAEGRADIALAGAADSLVSVESLLNLARHTSPNQQVTFLPGEGASFVCLGSEAPGGLSVLGAGSAIVSPSRRDIVCSSDPPAEVREAIQEARLRAWAEAKPFVSNDRPLLRLLGPRTPSVEDGKTELRPSDALGDCGAAGAALLLAAAWAQTRAGSNSELMELVAISPGGEATVLLVGAPD